MEYTTLPLLKEYVNEQTSNFDDLLTQCLKTASRNVESHTGRRFYADETATSRTYRIQDRWLSDSDGDLVIVDDISSIEGLTVEMGRGSTWRTISDYETEPDNALILGKPITYLRMPGSCWAVTLTNRIRVTAKWGWPAVPDEVVQATLLQAARLFKRKDSLGGVLGPDQFGASLRVARIDPDVQALLRPFVIKAVG